MIGKDEKVLAAGGNQEIHFLDIPKVIKGIQDLHVYGVSSTKSIQFQRAAD